MPGIGAAVQYYGDVSGVAPRCAQDESCLFSYFN